MSFSVLSIVSEDSARNPLTPWPGPSPDSVELEADDGSDIKVLTATTLTVRALLPGQAPRPMFRIRNIRASVLISDQRVAVACSKYEKGGGWAPFGGITSGGVALAANAVSKARAAKRRRGKMLVGHIRYPWILTVGFKEKTGVLREEALRLGIANPVQGGQGGLILDIGLPRDVSAREVARAVTQRAATYRLAHDTSMPSDEHERLQGFTRAQSLNGAPDRFVSYFFVDMPSPLATAYTYSQ